MPLIEYIYKDFRADALDLIRTANLIIEDYDAQGYKLTLRQLYYQFVSRDIIPNTEKSYKRIGSIINDARLAGLIDWEAIEDRTRFLRHSAHWDKPADIIKDAAMQFRVDKWEGQTFRPEVWIEKDALIGVIERVCAELDIPYFSCRGYVSQSEMWAAAQRYEDIATNGQTPVILHFGDHDPSGIDMSRDIKDRIKMFLGDAFDLKRIALNRDQIDQYDPPPNPAKMTDSRYIGYIREHGENSWELDALEPRVIESLIRDKVLWLRDDDRWNERVRIEDEGREYMMSIAMKEAPDV